MNIKRNKRAPIILMAISLGLLALFEIFWLKSEYESQEKWFEREQSHIFFSAIRSLEDSLFSEIALHPFEMALDSTQTRSSHEGRVMFRTSGDTSKTMIVLDKEMSFSRGKHKEMLKRRPHQMRPFLIGAFAYRLSESQDSATVASQLTDMIKTELSRDSNAVLQLDHKLEVWLENDSLTHRKMNSAHFEDAWSNQHFAFVFADNKMFLLKRMWRQILFAVFLFTCISVAFSLIYSSLIKQWRLAVIRTDFINNITHELKTPLSTVRVALEAISNFSAANDPKRTAEYLEISQKELDRLSMLIDKVLQMSQLSEGQVKMHIEQFDIKDLIAQTLLTMKVQFERQSAQRDPVDIEFDCKGEGFDIEGDPLLLTGVIYNLLDNAMKYSGQSPKIHIQLRKENGHIDLIVKDNGQGIPPAFQDKIFDKFFRVPTGDQHNTKGHGLGLSYVAEIIKQHHGKLSVKSEVGVGSEFNIMLPLRYAN